VRVYSLSGSFCNRMFCAYLDTLETVLKTLLSEFTLASDAYKQEPLNPPSSSLHANPEITFIKFLMGRTEGKRRKSLFFSSNQQLRCSFLKRKDT
jgi:hypothetical protein